MKADPSRLHGVHVLADDDPRWTRDPVEQARAACAGGAQVVQLRAKLAPDAQALDWGRAIRAITRSTGSLFIVNDRFDLALAVEADGVHLGQQDLPPAALPDEARERLLVGRSTHGPRELRAARHEPVDYVAFGPVFGTTSKETRHDARGLEALAEARRLVSAPLVAIGGIDVGKAAEVAARGADAIAVISCVVLAEDPTGVTRELARAFARGPGAGNR